MNTYTYSEARQRLASLLDKAKKEGKVLIKRKDGTIFELKNNNDELSTDDVKIEKEKEETLHPFLKWL